MNKYILLVLAISVSSVLSQIGSVIPIEKRVDWSNPGYNGLKPKNINSISEIKELRLNILKKLSEWLDYEYIDDIVFAIAIQEIDAWLLTLFSNKETGLLLNSKERLLRIINESNHFSKKVKQTIFSLNENKYEQYNLLSQDFRKIKKLSEALTKNSSLKMFCDDLERFKIE